MLISYFYKQTTSGKQKAYAVSTYSLKKSHTKCITFTLQNM